MTAPTDTLAARRADLLEAVRLEDFEAANDPEDEPYRSQYAARATFQSVLEALRDEEDPRSRAAVAALTARLGANFFDTEERPEGEGRLLEAMSLSSRAIAATSAEAPLFIFTLIQALNTLGRLFSSREAYKEALKWLEEADKLYEKYREEDRASQPPASFEAVLGLDEEAPTEAQAWSRFESLHTKTLYFLAQVHCKIDGNAAISAHYCGATLCRQLDADDLDPLDWSLNAAGLSQFFLTRCRFAAARHCLASAEAMFQEKIGEESEKQAEGDRAERIAQARADLHRCWAKYAIFLLDPNATSEEGEEEEEEKESKVSKKERKREREEEKEAEEEEKEEEEKEEKTPKAKKETPEAEKETPEAEKETPEAEEGSPRSEDSSESEEKQQREEAEAAPLFSGLPGLERCEALIGCARPDSLETARPFFLFAQQRLELAKKHYLLEEQCSDHVSIVQDHSRAFRLLAEHWDSNVERQCRMHKRRLDMLREMVAALNPQHFLMICRQLLFEIAETLQAMVTAKLTVLPRGGSDRDMRHAVKKVNALANEGITFYQRFVDSFKKPDGSMPEQFSLDETRPVLLAYFHIGHLSSKRLEFDKRKRIESIEASLKQYQKVVDYCDRFPEARQCAVVELDLAKEMVQLLPGKIRQVALDKQH